jgi:23S rRNA-/tRNA-specific pseudouridylate synthase
VLLDGRSAPAATLVRAGQRVVVTGDAARESAGAALEPQPAAAPSSAPVARAAGAQPQGETPALRVLWEGLDLFVVSKAAGVHTHGGRSRASVADALAHARPELLGVGPLREAGVVHRLDRDTSGVLLVAKHAAAYAALREAFRGGRIRKDYIALTAGDWREPMTIERPLARRRTRVVPARRRDRALAAVSVVAPLERGGAWSLVAVTMSTGVTHQVRAHLALCGHPILGDARYGGPPSPPGTRAGQLLHAMAVTLPDGRAFAAPAAADFVRALWWLRGRRSG